MFSRIASGFHAETNDLYRLRRRIEARGHAVLDLVSGNVTEHGIRFPQGILEEILVRHSGRCLVYRPDSFGQREAREAVSAYYQAQGIRLPPENILLTPGTSVAYWYAFKLLAEEGDEILCPNPSYPLFDYIASLSGVRLFPYPLVEARSWALDIDRLEASLSSRTRALVLISPHNPTGRVMQAAEIAALADMALRHDLAIISDEVFSEFLLDGGTLPRPAASAAPLVITLNGFSKMFALPGIKLGWMGVSGDSEKAAQAMRALELISDTFLPVSEIAQAAVADVFRMGSDFLAGYAAAVRERWRCAEVLLAGCRRCTFVPPAGGFYVTLALVGLDEQEAAESILCRDNLLVHPGYFYDLDGHHLVMSFVQEPEVIRETLPRLVDTLEHLAGSRAAGRHGAVPLPDSGAREEQS